MKNEIDVDGLKVKVMFLLKQLIRMLYVQMTLKECNQLATGKDLVCKKEEIKNINIIKQYKNV